MTTSLPCTFDDNGNTLTDSLRTNTWDSQNRLVQCVKGGTTSDFLYGADGNRRQTSVTTGGTTTVRKNVLDNGMMIWELDANNVSKATYLQGASGAVYRREDSTSRQTLQYAAALLFIGYDIRKEGYSNDYTDIETARRPPQ